MVRFLGLGLLLLGLLLFPLAVELPYPQHVMILIFLYAMMGLAWNIIGGYAGQVSLGDATYFGIGAYTTAILLRELNLSPWVGMALGALNAVVVSLVLGYPCFRVRGHYFAIATIALNEIVATIFTNWDFVGGAVGIYVPILPESFVNLQFHRSKAPYYYIALGMLILVILLNLWLSRSRLGYYFRAIRADQDAARALGIDITRYKLIAYALTAAITSLGGSFYAMYVLYIDPTSVFAFSISLLVVLVAVLGGVGTVAGPILGSVILISLSEGTRVLLGGTGRALDVAIYGLLVMAISVLQPQGLVAWFRALRQPKAREVKVGRAPS
ncbi:MAG: branched-chain amino acid ABC transporter permease [Chloroflexota bacterium]